MGFYGESDGREVAIAREERWKRGKDGGGRWREGVVVMLLFFGGVPLGGRDESHDNHSPGLLCALCCCRPN